MSPRVPTLDTDIIEAVRDDIESIVAEVRERQETYNGCSPLLT
jgi:hypothetical protein